MSNIFKSDYIGHVTNRARGVCTMIPKQLSYKVVKQISDENGRFLLLHTFIDNSEFVLVNLYAPTKDNPEEQKLFLNFVREHLCHFLGKRIIMRGDFNIYMNPELDKKGGICEKQSECSVILQDLVDELNLCDIYRLQNPDKHRYTWRNKGRNGWVHSRLDMFLVSQDLQFQKIKALIHPSLVIKILKCWHEIYTVVPTSYTDMLQEKLCNNTLIQVGGKPLNKEFDSFTRKGILCISDLVENKVLISRDRLNEKFECNIPIMLYNSLISSIPFHWKEEISRNYKPIMYDTYDIPHLKKKIFKSIPVRPIFSDILFSEFLIRYHILLLHYCIHLSYTHFANE